MNTLRARLSLSFLVVIGLTLILSAWTMNNIAQTSFENYVHGQSAGIGRGEGRGQGQERALGMAEQAFLDSVAQGLAITALIGGGIALIAGIMLAWVLSRPLHDLTQAIQQVAIGELGAQAPVHGTSEIQMLGRAFNTLSTALADGEALRKRMAADVAHELRTPVTVLRGHLEAMLDGVYPINAGGIAIAYDQTLYLGHLVEDLRLLTLAEAQQLPLEIIQTDIHPFITPILESFAPLAEDAGLQLSWKIAPNLPPIAIDPLRMRQVVNNILANALHYTPSGGDIQVMIIPYQQGIRISISNTTHEQIDIKNAFTPFWRGQLAQEADKGGSGLGLAIAKQLVELHQGKLHIEAHSNKLIFHADLPEPIIQNHITTR